MSSRVRGACTHRLTLRLFTLRLPGLPRNPRNPRTLRTLRTLRTRTPAHPACLPVGPSAYPHTRIPACPAHPRTRASHPVPAVMEWAP
ncbi:hypothetical protein SSP531S_52470 [Streptomyces spongiicola]|uniref:Uncharacterized protein n=1 Tax=Streptomyces spongiicola TaxID=1690221 RepID=A0A388T6W5_9ACTN|nr:hypothetical protein SSP531S_52470 [Streptomyces spongiicola]